MAQERPSTTERLASRVEKPGLQRRQMGGGGEVFTGELASRSLKAVGARAMTVDRSIIVSDDFDPNKPEDQALFAHEQHHLEQAGGEGTNAGRDEEEIEARAVERMVLHRALGAASAPASAAPSASGTSEEGPRGGSGPEAGAAGGYAAMTAMGFSHADIVNRMAREVIQALDSAKSQRAMRGGDGNG